MPLPAASLLVLLATATPADAPEDGATDCTITVEPGDAVAQDADLVVTAGARVNEALALRGDVIVRRGAQVKQAVALGGSVIVEDGAVVEEDVLALGGDVRVAPGGRIRSDVVAIGGSYRGDRAQVAGHVVAGSFDWGGRSLEERIREELRSRGHCRVERKAR